MATLTIRNVDERVVERLKDKARQNRRSLEAELRQLIADHTDRPSGQDLLERAKAIAAMTPKRPQTDAVELVHETRGERID